MTLLHLIFAGGLLALVVLISYTVKKSTYATLGLSLGVIVAFGLLSIAAYQVQIGYDHMHMTSILKRTAEAIRAGNSAEVVAAYDRFSAARTNTAASFWDARNQLYADLASLGTATNLVQPDGPANGSQPFRSETNTTSPKR
jgi:hypothetical protein